MITKAVGVSLLVFGVGLAPVCALAQKPQTVAAPAEPLPVPTRPMTTADVESLRAELRSSRKQTMASTLKLTDAEATRFWPVYDQHAAELTRIKDEQYKLIVEYANAYGKIDDKAAQDFITRWTDLDVRTTQLRARYVPIIGKVLPGTKTASWAQIDRRMSMLIDLKIASLFPLVQSQSQR
jgi:hypothetical protein